jgi:hypothetical protein
MATDSCRGWRELIGVYVLGQLDERHSTGLIAHLDGCPLCREEVTELSAVAHLLPVANPLHEDGRPTPPPHLETGIIERVRTERRREFRTRLKQRTVTTLVAAAAMVIGLIVGSFLYSPQTPDGHSNVPEAQITLQPSSGGLAGGAVLEYLPWGTRIDLTAKGLEPGIVYQVFMKKTDGSELNAGSFRAQASKEIHVTFAAAIDRDECKAIEVRSPNGTAVLRADMPWAASAGSSGALNAGDYRSVGL